MSNFSSAILTPNTNYKHNQDYIQIYMASIFNLPIVHYITKYLDIWYGFHVIFVPLTYSYIHTFHVLFCVYIHTIWHATLSLFSPPTTHFFDEVVSIFNNLEIFFQMLTWSLNQNHIRLVENNKILLKTGMTGE